MLQLTDIETSYGEVKALRGISLFVDSGEIVALIGSNGAGKTTTLMTISGIVRAKKGQVLFEGEDITNQRPHLIAKRGISHCPEGRRIFPKLTVYDNLELGAFCRGDIKKNLPFVYALFPILRDRQNQQAGTLSGGEQQMLALARSLMSSPKLLMLDEPSLGIAPILVEKIFEAIREINREGITVLLVEQNAYEALRLSDRTYVLENGLIKFHGVSSELQLNKEIKKAYLGEGSLLGENG